MNDYDNNNSDNKPFFAFALLAGAIVLLVAWQVIVSFSAHSQLQAGLKARTEIVGKAELAQKNLESFVLDLVKLSETNEGAKAIVDKYQIKKGPNAQPANN